MYVRNYTTTTLLYNYKTTTLIKGYKLLKVCYQVVRVYSCFSFTRLGTTIPIRAHTHGMATDHSPGQFLKCPDCHRTGTVKLTLFTDGDVSLRCRACDAHAMGYKLHESSRVYS